MAALLTEAFHRPIMTVMVIVVVVVCALVGMTVGAWLNQVVVRAPVKDRSARIALLAPPLIAPLTTRRERAICIVTGAVFALMGARFGPHLHLLPFLVGSASMVAISVIDLDTMRIPDRITFPTFGLVMTLIVSASLLEGEPGWIIRSAIGAAAFAGVLGIIWFIYPAGMGFGDVKFALVLGAMCGFISPLLVAYALLASSFLGSIVGIVVAGRARDRKRAFPFGPWLCVGTWVVLVCSRQILP